MEKTDRNMLITEMDIITAINKDQFDKNYFFWLAVGNVFLGYSELPKSEARHMWLCQEYDAGKSVVWTKNPEYTKEDHNA